MTLENVKALSDSELAQVITWAQDEQKARAEKRKRETIAKIKEMAGAVGVTVSIGGQRGMPVRTSSARIQKASRRKTELLAKQKSTAPKPSGP